MTQIPIDGPKTERPDGTVRCIGYGIDNQGRVTGRFALPKGHEWDAPDSTDTINYVDSMDALPPKDDHYRER